MENKRFAPNTLMMLICLVCMMFVTLFSTDIVFAADDYPAKYKSAAKDSIVDEWKFYNRECTSFVAWCLNSRNGVAFTNYYGGVRWGNAGDWGSAAKSLGIAVNNTPAVGSVAWWSSGHVGWVSAVNGNNVTTEEYNWNNDGAYHTRTQNKSTITGYIHIKDMSSTPTGPTGAVVDINMGVYSIHSALDNNLVLDVADGSTKNGANIQTYTYHGGPAQRFNIIKQDSYYLIRPQCSNLLLDTKDNSDVSGANIQQCLETGAHGQHWEFVDAGGGYYYIRSYRGGYVDVTDGVKSKQVNIQACRYFGGPAQKWKLVEETRDVSDGYYSIRSTADTNLALDIVNGAKNNGTNLRLYNYNGSRAQTFHVVKANGKYTIKPLCSGLLLDTENNSAVSGANIFQWESTGAKGQFWKFVTTAKDNYYIRSTLGNYIDITDGKIVSGTNIQSCRFFGGAAQKWKLVKEDISKFKPATPQPKVTGTNGKVTVQWNSVDTANYKNKYDVRLFNNSTATGNYSKVAWGVDGTSYSFNLSKGTYSVTVAAVDKIDSAIFSNAVVVAFSVDDSGKVVCASHKWDNGKVTKEPTCTEAGEKTFTCSVCKTTKTEPIKAKGHSWNSFYTIDVPATYDNDGLESIHCKTCGSIKPGSSRSYSLDKANNTLYVKGKTINVKYSKLKKKTQVFKVSKALTIKNAQGELGYSKTKGNKKITINKKTGKITVKKGLKKGKYKVIVRITADGTNVYNPVIKKVTFTVKVK